MDFKHDGPNNNSTEASRVSSLSYFLWVVLIISLALSSCGPPTPKPTPTPIVLVVTPTFTPAVNPTVSPGPSASPVLSPTPSLSTSVPEPDGPIDLRLGYVDRWHCPLITHIAKVILEDEYGYKVSSTVYDSIPELFSIMEANQVDITFCYAYPTDEADFSAGYTDLIGSGYLKLQGQSFMVMTAPSVKAKLRRNKAPFSPNGRCVYMFFRQLQLSEDHFNQFPTVLNQTGGNPVQAAPRWVQEHPAEVEVWTNCESQ